VIDVSDEEMDAMMAAELADIRAWYRGEECGSYACRSAYEYAMARRWAHADMLAWAANVADGRHPITGALLTAAVNAAGDMTAYLSDLNSSAVLLPDEADGPSNDDVGTSASSLARVLVMAPGAPSLA